MEQSSSTFAASLSNAEINDAAATAPSPRTVRRNWLRFSWNQISGASKVILLISFILSIIQVKKKKKGYYMCRYRKITSFNH